MNDNELFARVDSAVRAGDETRLTDALYDLSTHVMENDGYDEADMDRLLALLENDNVRAQSVAWMIWKNLEENWSLINERQRERIRHAAENAFDRTDDWMWSFMIGSLFAECFADRRALEVLARQRLSAREAARSMLPDALRNLARHTDDDALRRDARRELSFLEMDHSPAVRKEAADAARRWS